MIKRNKKLKIALPILVLFYLNFYFLSPFIHEHPVEVEGHVEMENVSHSHLERILSSSTSDSYISDEIYSHTHNFAFDIPIIIQPTEKFDNKISSSTLCQNDEYSKELESKFDVEISANNPYDQVLWERYVQFATNNSPPITQNI